MPYVLEVLRFYSKDDSPHVGRVSKIGYMNKIFETKYEARLYYDNNNPHMRSMNKHDMFHSDWDPTNNMRYVVRHYNGKKILDVPPFFESKNSYEQCDIYSLI